MPIYEYECEVDNEKLEIEFPITAVPQNVRCPKCDTELKRIYSVPGVKFNGSGFYKTDNPK